MRRGARIRAVGSLLSILVAAACGSGRNDVVVEGMDVAVTVLATGSVHVEEHLAARFGDAPVTNFRRRAPVWRHDGVSDITASMDGTPFPTGDGPGHLQVGTGRALDVQWTFPPAPVGTHQFVLQYRAANAVGISGIRGLVSWLVLPVHRDFDVSAANVTLTLPESAILLQDPWVEEPGWTVTRLPHGLTAARSDIRRSEAATVGVEFTIDRMNATKPQWESDEDVAAEFVPAFVSAGLFILIVGAGVLAMLRLRFPASSASAGDPSRVSAARDLRIAAWAVFVLGLIAAAFVLATLGHLGIWPMAIPASLLAVGVMFWAGAARMLYFARVRDGRASV